MEFLKKSCKQIVYFEGTFECHICASWGNPQANLRGIAKNCLNKDLGNNWEKYALLIYLARETAGAPDTSVTLPEIAVTPS